MKTWLRVTSATAVTTLAALTLAAIGGEGPVMARLNQSPQPIVADGRSLDCSAHPCDAVARGLAAFHDRNLRDLGGNGRACADCHIPAEAFQLSPAVARARLERLVDRRMRNKH